MDPLTEVFFGCKEQLYKNEPCITNALANRVTNLYEYPCTAFGTRSWVRDKCCHVIITQRVMTKEMLLD